MQQVDDPPYLLVGTEVSAKYKGAFCEAKVSKVVRNIKVKVAYKQGLGSGIVSDFEIKATPGQLRVGTVVEVRHPERKDYVEATITKIQDCSQYTVVFDDGDITTLRRTALCLKSGRHFNESETLDQLPLTHPEHFGNPVVGGRRGRRRGQLNDDSSDDGDESDTKEVVNEKEEHIGKVVCVETESKKKDKEKWFPALVVAPTAQATVRIRVKDEYLVRSFKDGRYYTVPKKEATEFTRDAAAKQDGPAVQAALEYLDNEVLPPHWDRDSLFALSNSSSDNEDEIDSDSSDDEPREEKDRFVAQLYKYMDDRGTPLNKVPSIQNRDVDLYRLFRAVQKRGGYNRVTSQNQWKSIAIRLGFTPVTVSITNLVKQAFKKFLQPYGEFHRKLGCSMLMSPRNSNRSKGRSLVRANSVASPKLVEPNKETIASTSKLVTASYNPTTTGTTTAMATTTATATSSTTLSTPTTTVATAIFSVTTSTTTTTITSAITSLVTTPTTTMTSGITSAAVPATVAVAANASTSAVASDSEDTSESSQDTNNKNPKRKLGGNGANANTTTTGKVKTIVEKYEEKLAKDDGDVPLSKIKAAAALKEAMETKEKDKDSGNGSKECSSGQVTRDSSPAGSSATTGKKEKHQRKQSAQNDDKRSKRKKDENIVEKIDTGDFIVETGDKLKVYYHEKRVTYEAKVIEIAVQRGTPMYLVHYTGWNNRYDEWVPRERIAENLTKGLKQKGRSSSIGRTCNEKNKENPSKPPAVINTSPTSSSSCSVGATTPIAKGTTTGGGKRGRWRSDSMPPRSSTPSSVASNSSRTKSPATSSAVKRRPQRQMTNTSRRVSAVSDVSIPTEESDTDSDEPVRRPTRGLKTNIYSKSPTKSKASASAPNSQSDTDENDNDDDADGTSRRTKSTLRKGSHIDLNQICSELKGLQNLKTIGDVNAAQDIKTDFKDSRDVTFVKIKREKSNNDLKTLTSTTPSCVNMLSGIAKNSTNIETKVDISKRISAEVSSGSESFGDDDSQSSDKTTQLENMTKKFQQIINADKQRAQDKAAVPTSTISKMNAAFSGSKVVEKIIKDRENEKRQESLKIKPGIIKDETKTFFANSSAIKTEEESNVKYEDKKPLLSAGVITPVRFDAITTITNTPKYASVIVEKPLTVSKKLESALIYGKKLDLPKRIIQNESSAPHVSKKFAEPSMHKEIVKVELAAACSPSSISSISSVSSTNSSISSATSTSRSLPDMSKLDISGSSSMASSSTSPSYSNLMKDAIVAKPISPDVYEFKDPEPFEFEMRKSSLVGPSSSATSVITANLSSITSSTSASTGSLLRNKTIAKVENYSAAVSNTVTVSGNRKKRGSPMKEALKDSSTKHLKLEERTVGGTAIPILADAKLLHHSLLGVGSSTLTTTNVKGSHGIGTHKSLTSSTIMHAPSAPKLASIHQGSTSTITSVSSSQLTAFDALRKSPNFNLNINALNEELAQTVQETTRALTDAMQCPLTPTSVPGVGEVSPNKTSLSPRANYTATLAVTQTLPIVTTVATKLYTPTSSNSNEKSASVKEDLSNVFGLSFGPGSSNKDSKFEFEDAKKLLSASVEAFDLDPTKFESKPTPSIADKVLKAISQKKEEEETKKQEAISRDKISAVLEPKKGKEPASSLNSLTYNICPNSVPKSTDEINLTTVAGVASAAPNLLINEPLKINTELPGTNSSLLSGTLGSFLVAKRGTPPLTSPDCKIGLLESIGTKTQLTETIQKLECAIQRRTPVTSHSVTPTTPLSVAAAETYSEESNDSTDSERRLVIEDVIEENVTPQVEQKSSPLLVRPEPTKPITSITSIKLNSHTLPTTKPFLHSQHDITTLTPIKLVSAQTNKVIVTTIATTINASNTMTSATVSSRLMTKLHGSTTALIYQPNINKTIITSSAISNVSLVPPIIQKPSVYLASNLDQPLTSGERIVTDISGNNFILQSATNVPISTTIKAVGAGNVMTKNVPTTSTGVPIDLPDIPASVVVASSAIPSVMAAAHAAAAALQTSKNSTTMVKQTVAITSGQQPLSSSSIHITPIKVSIGPSNTTSTVVQGQKMTTTFKPLDNLMNSIGVRTISTPVRSHSNIVHQLPTTTKAIYHSMPAIPATVSSASSTSGFYLNPLTELRPDDGLKPLCNDMHQQGRDKEKLGVITLHSPASIITQSKETSTTHYVTLEQCANITSNDHHNDAINQLLCEETIPGSPASVITTREDSQERIAITGLMHDTISGITTIKDYSNLETNLPNTTVAPPSVNSSPNDSASQEDESSEDLKKTTEQEIEEIITRKRRRVRKQQDDNLSTISGDHLATQQSQQHTKRKRSKKNAAGSDSDDNSDAISQRSNTTQSSGKQQAQFSQQQQQHQQRPQQLQVHNTTATGGSKSCPYNFLVQLDPSLSPDQCISILLKQIQDLRKTYNIIKSDLASIDRRRKKLRRREREKKQQQQQQHQQQQQQHQQQQHNQQQLKIIG